jgi:hypothetical protein
MIFLFLENMFEKQRLEILYEFKLLIGLEKIQNEK